MLLWIVIAALTVAACLAVILPLARKGRVASDASAHEIEVYRDQLSEIDRDTARGLIDLNEADQARAEIARRILRSEKVAGKPASGSFGKGSRIVATICVLSIPLASWGIYAFTGSPELPGQPLAERLARDPRQSGVDELVARAEQHLRQNPEDGRGWEVLAPIYLRLGRVEDSVVAFNNAIRIQGATAALQAGLGEALVLRSGGVVNEAAVAAFTAARQAEPEEPRARYFLALADAQEGRLEEARLGWEAMARSEPAGSPWRDLVTRALAGLPGSGESPGNGQANEGSATESTDAVDRGAMIEQMVAGLDARLEAEPDDPEGWRRLIRSYVVLNRPQDARRALERGRAALAARAEESAALVDFAAGLGIRGENP